MVNNEFKLTTDIFEKNESKKQILLSNSFRYFDDFKNQLIYRFNGKSKKIPHYFIKKNGEIFCFISPECISEYFLSSNKNDLIHICLENIGWVEKVPMKDYYSNWLGIIKKQDIYEKKWRDYFFWDTYTDEQINSLIELCKNITMEMSMKYKFIGHNTKSVSVETYEGITCRSNYNSFYTDLNPSFPFSTFIKKLEYEK
jgi:N-acetyl-anhydromuramyl-L-alanine amidase AmpD